MHSSSALKNYKRREKKRASKDKDQELVLVSNTEALIMPSARQAPPAPARVVHPRFIEDKDGFITKVSSKTTVNGLTVKEDEDTFPLLQLPNDLVCHVMRSLLQQDMMREFALSMTVCKRLRVAAHENVELSREFDDRMLTHGHRNYLVSCIIQCWTNMIRASNLMGDDSLGWSSCYDEAIQVYANNGAQIRRFGVVMRITNCDTMGSVRMRVLPRRCTDEDVIMCGDQRFYFGDSDSMWHALQPNVVRILQSMREGQEHCFKTRSSYLASQRPSGPPTITSWPGWPGVNIELLIGHRFKFENYEFKKLTRTGWVHV